MSQFCFCFGAVLRTSASARLSVGQRKSLQSCRLKEKAVPGTSRPGCTVKTGKVKILIHPLVQVNLHNPGKDHPVLVDHHNQGEEHPVLVDHHAQGEDHPVLVDLHNPGEEAVPVPADHHNLLISKWAPIKRPSCKGRCP